MDELEEIRAIFVAESYESLDVLDRYLIELEKNPDEVNDDALGDIFRTAHSIKGNSGAFGFAKLEALTHAAESLLGRLRERTLRADRTIIDALLGFGDTARRLLGQIEEHGEERNGDDPELLDLLLALATSVGNAEPAATEPAPAATEPAVEALPEPAVEAVPEPTVEVVPAPKAEAAPAPKAEAAPAAEATSSTAADSSLRVDVDLLDRLMTLVGELVLARNQVIQFTAGQQGSPAAAAAQRLNLITTELQEAVMKTRMQPVGNVFGKVPRIVRDVSLACGKQVRIEMEGKETELDKTLIEAIRDPLVHLVRNSVDHGIERPDVRIAAGKPPEGRLRLRASHESGHVNVEISDDGAGIHLDRIKDKALERGVITPRQAETMSDREAMNIIFMAGFSSAEKITNVSGRGVGMDVVKSNLEKIGGAIEVLSAPGVGTTMKLKIPLTLAIIPACIVTCGGDRYLLPQSSLLELVRLEADRARAEIETIHGAPVYRLRGNLLPLVYLDDLLGVRANRFEDSPLNVVVLQNGDRPFGLVVDEVRDTEEIVVKPLGSRLKALSLYSGATIMGDGKVALILDVVGLAHAARVASEGRDRISDDRREDEAVDETADALMLCQAGDQRVVFPLSLVARLEELPRESVERTGSHHVIQYRGGILPLVPLADMLGAREYDGEPTDTLQVVVYAAGGRRVGFVVDRIIDIVSDPLGAIHPASRPGVVGSAVVQGRVAEVLDVQAIIRAFDPDYFDLMVEEGVLHG